MPSLFKGATSRRNPPDDPEEFRLTLVEHLEELRDRLVRSISVLVVGWVVGWFVMPTLYTELNQMVLQSIQPVLGKANFKEVFHQTTEPFMLKLKLSFMFGLLVSMPFIVAQLWGFVAPGLKPAERKPVTKLVPWVAVLFVVGAGFSWLIMPAALSWFAGYVAEFPGVDLYQEAGTMVFFVLKMLIAFGIAFQLPLIVYGLGAMDLLSAETLTQYWRHAATVIFIVSAMITPSNDPVSMLMMAIPLVVLFSISVYLVKLTQGRRRRAAAREEAGA